MMEAEEIQATDMPPEAAEEPQVEETDKSYIMFPVPQGYEIPEEAKAGKEFDAVATVKVNKNGEMCLVALDGSPVESQESETPEEDKSAQEEPDYSNESFTESVNRRMAGAK